MLWFFEFDIKYERYESMVIIIGLKKGFGLLNNFERLFSINLEISFNFFVMVLKIFLCMGIFFFCFCFKIILG